jgi:diguanylate cyclase (GGDEF)-like protein
VALQCSVLAVDDDFLILAMLTAMLSPEFEVLKAPSAASARDLLAQRDVDIILADQQLSAGSPADSGVNLLESARSLRPGAIRILMTGKASLDDALAAINRGQVHRYLLKPLDRDELRQTLRGAARTLLLERSHEQLLDQMRQLNLELEVRVTQRTRELEEALRQLQYKNSILEKMALTDPLTGLPNRRAMDRMVRTEIQRRSRHPSAIALAIVDVDHFKDINTRFHLSGGDHALVWLGQVLSGSVRTIDSVGRIGGEEFMVLAPDTGRDGATALAERIREGVAAARTTFNEHTIQITVSIGVAAAARDKPVTYEQLKECAADALAEAKQAGRNRCVVKVIK